MKTDKIKTLEYEHLHYKGSFASQRIITGFLLNNTFLYCAKVIIGFPSYTQSKEREIYTKFL